MEKDRPFNLKIISELFSKQPSFFEVSSGCMRPLISRGNFVLIKNCQPAKLKKGEIILYRSGDNLFIHRFLGTRKNGLITKADMNFKENKPILESQIVGRVSLVKKRLFNLNFETEFFRAVNYLLFFLGKLQVGFYLAFKKTSNLIK